MQLGADQAKELLAEYTGPQYEIETRAMVILLFNLLSILAGRMRVLMRSTMGLGLLSYSKHRFTNSCMLDKKVGRMKMQNCVVLHVCNCRY